ncbi:DMT family transporter [Dyadobacter jiangsuensis]|uniref:Threonine/homoserine efflux transporter RhtA n=1 Tax=Dyadobacter jiangsuensis TaxID=1591085 RepID=A0A2P8GF50_9BACT|nr:DMT family transporter [Dyadobacter jiangsuensis]PSL32545.1 threonine/homoserine efflux transporter RhtA [Dyadobacter jiangsuensis]
MTQAARSVTVRIMLQVALAMASFAANSLLCRIALSQTSTDPAAFTIIRLLAGAVTLSLIILLRKGTLRNAGTWQGAFSLLTYAIAFSFAYVNLPTGTGALLLFGTVQATMIITGLYQGEHLRIIQWTGLLTAFGGLIILVAPGIHAPDPFSALLMAIAGMAWGVYSLLGRKQGDPLTATAGNFLKAAPVSLLFLPLANSIDAQGAIFAVISGSVSSGVGYAIWYSILPSLKATQAASVQLTVPVIASTAAVFILGEHVTFNLVIASVAILGGIALVILGRKRG